MVVQITTAIGLFSKVCYLLFNVLLRYLILLKCITSFIVLLLFNKEFDPGSGRTLAARLTHASRTEVFNRKFSDGRVDSLVANG